MPKISAENSNEPVCNQFALEVAISGGLNQDVEQQLAIHLETCEQCQQRMDRIAGDEKFWNRVTQNLSGMEKTKSENVGHVGESHSSIFVSVNAEGSSITPELNSSRDDSLTRVPFDPPLHPEMLGRVDGFSIEKMIGRGGMGVVYKGFDAELNRPVAIKFLAPHLAASGVARQRFAREAKAAAAVVHPNVVPIYSIGTSSETPYLVMALVSGRSLQKHIEENGPLPAEDIVRIAQQIATGLAAAHSQGLVHRDIKPANILLEKDVSRVLITDFGLARAADDAVLTQSGWLAGTPHYMSPEQAKGDDVDQRSDLFSLGSVMYFMATGREPFRAENPYAVLQKIGSKDPAPARSINSNVPSTVDALIAKLLSKNPEKRFESATAAQEVFTQYLAHIQNPTQCSKPKIHPNNSGNERMFVLCSIAATLALFAGLLWWVGFYGRSQGRKVRIVRTPNVLARQPVANVTATPSWISDLTTAKQWKAEYSSLEQSVSRMEQLPVAISAKADSFEREKMQLEKQIRNMESQMGLRSR